MRALPPLCLDPPAKRRCDAGRLGRVEDSPERLDRTRHVGNAVRSHDVARHVRRPQCRRQCGIAAAAHRQRQVRPGGHDPLDVRRNPLDLRQSLRRSGRVREAVRRDHLRSGADAKADLVEIRSERDDALNLAGTAIARPRSSRVVAGGGATQAIAIRTSSSERRTQRVSRQGSSPRSATSGP